MPFILDNILVFLFRVLRLSWLDSQSRGWAITEGVVEDAYCHDEMYPYAKIVYTYEVNGENYFGSYIKGFWYRGSSRDFTGLYPSSRKMAVRYNPNQPSESFLCEVEPEIVRASVSNKSQLGPTKTPFGDW
jgi:hypothetical protein